VLLGVRYLLSNKLLPARTPILHHRLAEGHDLYIYSLSELGRLRGDADAARTAGTTSPTCARAAAIGRSPARSTSESRSRVPGLSGTMARTSVARSAEPARKLMPI